MEGQVRILSMYAFVVVDDDGTEGVIGVNGVPMVGADLAMVGKLLPVVQDVADQLGKPVTLVHFSQRSDSTVLTPRRRR